MKALLLGAALELLPFCFPWRQAKNSSYGKRVAVIRLVEAADGRRVMI
jgi:uncharacterized RDD family membrane protein YckC